MVTTIPLSKIPHNRLLFSLVLIETFAAGICCTKSKCGGQREAAAAEHVKQPQAHAFQLQLYWNYEVPAAQSVIGARATKTKRAKPPLYPQTRGGVLNLGRKAALTAVVPWCGTVPYGRYLPTVRLQRLCYDTVVTFI